MPCKFESCMKNIGCECGCRSGTSWIIILVRYTSQALCMWDGSPPASNIQHTSFPFLSSALNRYTKKVLWLILFTHKQKEQKLSNSSGSMLHDNMLDNVSNVSAFNVYKLPSCACILLHAEFPSLRSVTTNSWLSAQSIMQIVHLLGKYIIQETV